MYMKLPTREIPDCSFWITNLIVMYCILEPACNLEPDQPTSAFAEPVEREERRREEMQEGEEKVE